MVRPLGRSEFPRFGPHIRRTKKSEKKNMHTWTHSFYYHQHVCFQLLRFAERALMTGSLVVRKINRCMDWQIYVRVG